MQLFCSVLSILHGYLHFFVDSCVLEQLEVQVQVCFTSVCGQVQPLDVALLSNSVQHSHAIGQCQVVRPS
jgi:hypothetical protein